MDTYPTQLLRYQVSETVIWFILKSSCNIAGDLDLIGSQIASPICFVFPLNPDAFAKQNTLDSSFQALSN